MSDRELTAAYRRSRGWDPEPGTRTRISCELPRDLVARLNHQARLLEADAGSDGRTASRAFLIETAIMGLLASFEAIDADEAGRQPGPS